MSGSERPGPRLGPFENLAHTYFSGLDALFKSYEPALEPNVKTVESIEFKGPFPEKTRFKVELPRDFRDDAAPAVLDVHRCVLPGVLHLRFPCGGGADDGPRDASLAAPPGFGPADPQALALGLPGVVRGDEPLNRGTLSGLIPILIPSHVSRGRELEPITS
jgi:hypothetical protein